MKLQIVRRRPSRLLGQYSKIAALKLLMLSLSLVSTMLFSTVLFSTVMADGGGYISPRFSSGTGGQPLALQQASPLAGGPAAAQGGQFMDVQGNAIVLPASYCQSGPGAGGYAAGGYGAAAGYGDPMAVDFGGYGTDQSGPHYFDVSLESVFLKPLDAFDGAIHQISAGVSGDVAQGNRIELLSGQEEFDPGWRIAGRFDLGPLSVIEGTYMGIFGNEFNTTITSEQAFDRIGIPNGPPNSLFSVVSSFGLDPVGGFPPLDAAQTYTFNFESDLHSAEVSYRRYWMAYNSRVTGTFLLGSRYLRMTEGFSWNSEGLIGGNPLTPGSYLLSSNSENDLLGFQFGGDGWLTLRQGLRVGTEMKAGVYNNRFKLDSAGVASGNTGSSPPPTFAVASTGNQVAFAAEGGVNIVADIMPSWSIRGGYQVLYMSSLATIGGNINATSLTNPTMDTQGHALYHGFSGGIEYVW